MTQSNIYKTIDFHTAGEPLRVIIQGLPTIQGNTILEKREYFRFNLDHIRQALILEPRGHSEMYGAVLTEPIDPRASFGVIFMHQSGYSTMCGHGTIALAKYLIESGQIPETFPTTKFYLECPCDVIEVISTVQDGQVISSSFKIPSAYAIAVHEHSNIPGFGSMTYSVAYGGAYYGIVPASRLGLHFKETPIDELVKMGDLFTQRLKTCITIENPKPELAFLYGTILIDDRQVDEARYHLTVFGDGQVDRSPTGSGVAARVALDFARNRVPQNRCWEFRGISGESFFATGKLKERKTSKEDYPIVEVKVEGKAFYLGTTEWEISLDDPFAQGWTLPQSFSTVIQ